jgi:ribosomal protein S18 acetylase RimI-like enzyme
MNGALQRRTGIVVRGLTPDDLEAVVAIDAKSTGRRRDEYFRIKLKQNLAETGIKVSLAAEADGLFRGFLLARVYYGEFGNVEPVAVLDTLGVHPDTRGQGIGQALMEQLLINLAGLGVPTLRTEVAWEDTALLRFFQRQLFRPAARLCLELPVTHRP